MFENLSLAPKIIITVSLMLIAGYGFSRVAKLLKLPNVTGYIVAGIVIGPFCLNLTPKSVIDGMGFLADVSLSLIAFGTGEFFKISTLKKSGAKNVVLTLFESLFASAAVFAVAYLLGAGLAFSAVMGALAAATAPASTLMTIRQTKAKGEFVDTLLQVVALDDAVGLIAFSAAISVATASLYGTVSAAIVVKPIIYNIVALISGGLLGALLKLLIGKHSTDSRLIIAVTVLMGFSGACACFDVSPLLGCMAMGGVYMNLTDDEKLFKQIRRFSPPVLLLFFVRSGANFNLSSIFSAKSSVGAVTLGAFAAIYFAVRIFGKYSGAYVGALATNKSKAVRNYLGLALIPQAGVAIGLASFAARTVGGELGSNIETVILASSVLYELIGPMAAKLSLYLSHSYAVSQAATVRQAAVVPQTVVETPAEIADVTAFLTENAVEPRTPQPKIKR